MDVLKAFDGQEILESAVYPHGVLGELTELIEEGYVTVQDCVDVTQDSSSEHYGTTLSSMGLNVEQVQGANIEGLTLKGAGFSWDQVPLADVAASGFSVDDIGSEAMDQVAACGFSIEDFMGSTDPSLGNIKRAGFEPEQYSQWAGPGDADYKAAGYTAWDFDTASDIKAAG